MISSIEQGLREALLKVKKEMDTGKVYKESMTKAEIWAEMQKLKQEINKSENNNND